MLASLSVRDVVLIDRLDLEFAPGLGVLTGETGAGKSILLDSLGLALGGRAEARLLRRGAEQASVTAAFELPAGHPAFDLLRDQDLLEDGEALLLRRTLGQDGRTKAYVNDRPVSVGLLRDLGDLLVEIQGQFEQRGLLDSGTHRALLDAYGDLGAKAEETRRLHRSWQELQAERSEAEVALAQAKADEDYLRHAVAELNDLDPQPGEEERLAEQRTILMHAEKVGEAIAEAIAELDGSASEGARGADSAVGGALRVLERMADKAGGRLDPVIESLNRANAEIEEASATLASLTGDMDMEPGRLAEIEERYFALKDLARKHGVEVESLAPLRDELQERLLSIDSGSERLTELSRKVQAARDAYLKAAEALSTGRTKAAGRIDAAVNGELPPLKLEKARFATSVERLEEESWGPNGLDRIAFMVSTNPGAAPGPIAKIASGGELSRFLLALKVVLAEISPVPTLVFDEVDSGIGGATADAVGERLARLAQARQVLVVTHSPQVAARAGHHWQVSKETSDKDALTRVSALDRETRREEVARMLSGATVTEEARAQAERLMDAV